MSTSTDMPNVEEMPTFRSGDYQVPSFAPNGAKLKPGKVHGSVDDNRKRAEMILQHSMRHGAMPSPKPQETKTKKRAKQSVKDPPAPKLVIRADGMGDPDEPVIQPLSIQTRESLTIHRHQPPQPLIDIVFTTGFGKLKVKVIEARVEPTCVFLFFPDMDAVTFEPEPGDDFKLTAKGETMKVFATGFSTMAPDGSAYIIVLARKLEKEDADD